MQINARLVQEQEAALAAAASQQKKTRCCRKCGQPMKGHPRNQCPHINTSRVSVKAGTPHGTLGTHPEPHPEHPEHPEPRPEHPEPHPEHPEPHPEHPEPHPEHAGIRAMQQRTCFSINSRVSH